MAKPNPLDFRRENPAHQHFTQGVISVRAGDIRRKVPTVRAHEACSDRLFPGASPKLGESRCSSQGGFLWMLLDFSLWEPGTRSPVSIQPRRSSSSCHMLLCKARLQPEQVLLLPCPPPLSYCPACSDGEGRKGRVDVPQPHVLACAKKQRKLLEKGDT